VFVYGDPRRPTVTHVGTQTDTLYGDDCAVFWRSCCSWNDSNAYIMKV
jgi:hypothetical protein